MTMRNISSTSEEIYQTQNGNVRVERYGKRQWKVWPIGSRPSIVSSKAEAFRVAESLDSDRGGLRDVYTSNKSASTLDAEIDAFLKSKNYRVT